MLVGIAADAGVAVLISRNGDVVHGRFSGFFHAAQLGIHQQAALAGSGFGHQGVADGAVVGFLVVLLAPQANPGQAIVDVFTGEAQVLGVLLHIFDQGVVFGVLAFPGFIGFLGPGGVLFIGHHIQEVLANGLGVDAHEQGRFALGHEIPHIGVGLVAQVVEHEHLVQRLQSQGIFVAFLGHFFSFRPSLGHEVQQVAGIQHFALDLVAVLDQGHGDFMVGAVHVSVQLGKNVVVLGLLPAEFHGEVRIDLLQFFNEQRQHGFAAAGIAHGVECFAIGFFDCFLEQFFQRHGLSLGDDVGHVFRRGKGAQGKRHDHNKNKRDDLFHGIFFLSVFWSAFCRPLHFIILSLLGLSRKNCVKMKKPSSLPAHGTPCFIWVFLPYVSFAPGQDTMLFRETKAGLPRCFSRDRPA